MAVLDDIDDFLVRVRKGVERKDSGELDILRLRGRYLLSLAKELEKEAVGFSEGESDASGGSPSGSGNGSPVSGVVHAQLGAVLHMEAEGLKKTLEALNDADSAMDSLKETVKLEEIRLFREALWKEKEKN